MELMKLKLELPVYQVKPDYINNLLNCFGAVYCGGYAIKDDKYGKGARYCGPLNKINDTYCTWSWDEKTNTFDLHPVILTTDCLLTQVWKPLVTVTGARSGDTIMFGTEEDAVEWFKHLSSPEQLNMMVRTADYYGNILLFLQTRETKQGTSE